MSLSRLIFKSFYTSRPVNIKSRIILKRGELCKHFLIRHYVCPRRSPMIFEMQPEVKQHTSMNIT